LIFIGLGLVALAAAGVGGWYFWMARRPVGPVATGPSTAPSARVPTPASAAPTPFASASVPAPSVAPSARPTAPPTVAATAAPTQPPPTAAPVHVTGGDPLARARAQLRQGELGEAARGFAAHLRSGATAGTFSIQLFVACAPDTVQKAVSEVNAPELFILPVSYKGRECFRLCWGVYGNAAGAAAAGRSLPEYFVRGGAAPHVMSAAELLK
jgi:hypothetical protein